MSACELTSKDPGLPPTHTGKDDARTACIQDADASGNSQTIAPAFHPEFLAVARQLARVEVLMNPFEASPLVAGFPMTSLLNETLVEIWNKAEFGQVEDEVSRSPWQVVYSVAPWL